MPRDISRDLIASQLRARRKPVGPRATIRKVDQGQRWLVQLGEVRRYADTFGEAQRIGLALVAQARHRGGGAT